MKTLSVVIPSYNSEAYLEHCFETLPLEDERLEVLIVNDGSKDRTPEIAHALAAAHPNTVRAIDQENKGHGGACTSGIHAAMGLFVRILDSDDWFDAEAIRELLDALTAFTDKPLDEIPDLVLTNYVYNRPKKDGAFSTAAVRYQNLLPEHKMVGWADMKPSKRWQQLMMHALTYRRQLLIDMDFHMPEHCFYVDNIFAYKPLPLVQRIYYLNLDLYQYFIGRENQSVQDATLMRNKDQHVRVNHLLIEAWDLSEIEKISPSLYHYMFNYLEIMTVISSVILYKSDDPEKKEKFDALWEKMQERNPACYEELRKGILGRYLLSRGEFGRKTALLVYKLARKMLGYT